MPSSYCLNNCSVIRVSNIMDTQMTYGAVDEHEETSTVLQPKRRLRQPTPGTRGKLKSPSERAGGQPLSTTHLYSPRSSWARSAVEAFPVLRSKSPKISQICPGIYDTVWSSVRPRMGGDWGGSLSHYSLFCSLLFQQRTLLCWRGCISLCMKQIYK